MKLLRYFFGIAFYMFAGLLIILAIIMADYFMFFFGIGTGLIGVLMLLKE